MTSILGTQVKKNLHLDISPLIYLLSQSIFAEKAITQLKGRPLANSSNLTTFFTPLAQINCPKLINRYSKPQLVLINSASTLSLTHFCIFNRGIFWIFFLFTGFYTASSAPLRFHCAGGCWYRTQDFGIGSKTR
jgi:hypothetical protein